MGNGIPRILFGGEATIKYPTLHADPNQRFDQVSPPPGVPDGTTPETEQSNEPAMTDEADNRAQATEEGAQ
jgi:hypothetical protein